MGAFNPGCDVEEKSRVRVPKVFRGYLQQRSGSSFNDIGTMRTGVAFPLDNFNDVERGTYYTSNSLSSISIYHGFAVWRGHSSIAGSVNTTQEAAVYWL